MDTLRDWNPAHYLEYRNERTQPSIDLVNRIKINYNPSGIIDIGCGPGNSSEVLFRRWPAAKFTGLDSSENMIEKAKHDYPGKVWVLADALTFSPEDKFDILFSNATIQWIPRHEELITRFHQWLTERGMLAIQLPLFWTMPVGKSLRAIAQQSRWKPLIGKALDLVTIHDPRFYYDLLSRLFRNTELWVTDYMHVFDSHLSILNMIRSAALKPYFDLLTYGNDSSDFETLILEEIKKAYPLQEDRKVLFPFKRLFFTAYK